MLYKNKKRIYLDHAATTYTDPKVKAAMEPYWEKEFGNASSLYHEGRCAKEALDKSRKTVAAILGASANEIIFTGSGTESDNIALFGAANAYKKYGKHIISSNIEHHAILYALDRLKEEGFEITLIPVDENGIIRVKDFEEALRPDTILVSIGYANNEIGTIQPLAEISKTLRNFRNSKFQNPNFKQIQNSKSQVQNNQKNFGFNEKLPVFHTDACQAAPYLNLNVENLGVDLMTLNSSKVYGPKGVGCLYMRNGVDLERIIFGGGQERNLRSGTENTPGIVGFAKALEIAQSEKEKEGKRLGALRDALINNIPLLIPKTVLNGHPVRRLPNNVNVSILDIEGEALILLLDDYGISCSTGSACTSESLEPSHVILALGKPYEFAHGSVRITLGKRNTKKDIDYFLKVLPKAVKRLRKISPLNIDVGLKTMSHPEVFAGKLKKRGKSFK